MYIYGKNVAREKLNTNDKIVKAYVSNKFKDNDILNKLKENLSTVWELNIDDADDWAKWMFDKNTALLLLFEIVTALTLS